MGVAAEPHPLTRWLLPGVGSAAKRREHLKGPEAHLPTSVSTQTHSTELLNKPGEGKGLGAGCANESLSGLSDLIPQQPRHYPSSHTGEETEPSRAAAGRTPSGGPPPQPSPAPAADLRPGEVVPRGSWAQRPQRPADQARLMNHQEACWAQSPALPGGGGEAAAAFWREVRTHPTSPGTLLAPMDPASQHLRATARPPRRRTRPPWRRRPAWAVGALDPSRQAPGESALALPFTRS